MRVDILIFYFECDVK